MEPAAAVPPALPVPSPARPAVARRTIQGIRFEGVVFDARSHRLRVADQAAGPGTLWADAAAAMRDHRGLAALNAGFFTPEGQPLGRVVGGGRPAGSWNRSSALGAGVFLADVAGRMAIYRRERTVAAGASELLQAGPMLVEEGRGVTGLEAEKSAARSVLLWDGGHRWWLGHASACTLAALGGALAVAGPADWPVHTALNLDGGRSVDFAAAAAVAGGPVVHRPPWNRQVRNFLVLLAR